MRRTAVRSAFSAVRTEGGILPAELLERLAAGDKDIPGLAPEDYHLGPHERLGEAVNRSWSRLLGAWASFRDASDRLPEGNPATRLTRERWLLPLFQELGYGRLLRSKALEVDGKSFALSHLWHRSPIHLLGVSLTLDRRTPGVAGAAVASPHGLVQEYLNRSDDHLWGFVSNGRALRLLRDHHSLTRQAYVELDLEAIMEGELYSEFLLLWLICHQSRVEAEKPEECWLERWFQTSRREGVRALDKLRDGVKTAIEALGQGFLRHRGNAALQQALEQGTLDGQDYYRELLRLVYRLIFVFVAEDRDALLDPEASDAARDRYQRFYATRRLRRLADRRRGGPHGDLWQGLRLVMEALGDGCETLALPALGSFLWRAEAIPHLTGRDLGNADLMAAVRALGTIEDRGTRYPVNWRNIGAEELGSIYESLLELHPRFHRGAGTFELDTAAGHERKTTGSYYTPSSLVDCLLDSALDPVLDEAASKPDPETAILALTVCDPACGSGHFLVAAARRIAKRLAAVRFVEDEPSPEAVQEALRDVVGRCLYGVDINPMAVELCKVSLWMEAIEPGKPLSFLDHHIQVGNSLLGATPALLEKGIPDAAFKPITGDDKAFCRELKKYNKQARETRQGTLFDPRGKPWARIGDLAIGLLNLDGISDMTAEGVRRKEQRWQEILESEGYEASRLWADAWCAAFVWQKVDDPRRPQPMTEQVFRKMEENPYAVDPRVRGEVRRLAEEYGFFHWHLAFPGVLRASAQEDGESEAGWSGGFDVVLGNPPWDKIQPEEQKFFAGINQEIASTARAAERKKKIRNLESGDPASFGRWRQYCRRIAGMSSLIKDSGRLVLSARGNLNSYRLFVETGLQIVSSSGRAGLIVQSGLGNDKNSVPLFKHLIHSRRLVSFFDFENRKGLFPSVDSRYRFSLVTFLGAGGEGFARARFGLLIQSVAESKESDRIIELSWEELVLFNPSTGTCPTFRSRRDASIASRIYRSARYVKLNDEKRFASIDFLGELFNMTRDSAHFINFGSSRRPSTHIPLYEAKLIHQFDHRYAELAGRVSAVDVSSKRDPLFFPEPRFFVAQEIVQPRLAHRGHQYHWMCGFRSVSRATDERTAIAAIFPRSAVGNSINLVLGLSAPEVCWITANLNCHVFDFTARQKVGGINFNIWIMEQLPVIGRGRFEQETLWRPGYLLGEWIKVRVLELTYTAWDLQPFAQDCGYDGPPFRWNEARRFLLRCELDAAFFHLYGIERDDLDYIMETFPIVKRKDLKRHGEYRTKLRILDVYDAMQKAIDSGEPYQTLLDPPPADPRVAHPPREQAPGDGAAVIAFPSPPPEPATYQHPPDLAEVAEPAPSYDESPTSGVTPADRILTWLRDHHGWHARADILAALDDLSAGEWNSAIRQLVEFGEVAKKGQKRGTRYRIPVPDDCES